MSLQLIRFRSKSLDDADIQPPLSPASFISNQRQVNHTIAQTQVDKFDPMQSWHLNASTKNLSQSFCCSSIHYPRSIFRQMLELSYAPPYPLGKDSQHLFKKPPHHPARSPFQPSFATTAIKVCTARQLHLAITCTLLSIPLLLVSFLHISQVSPDDTVLTSDVQCLTQREDHP